MTNSRIKLSSIVAMAENHVIGKDGGMPWHISEDFKHFKRTTMGCPMIMGRKCFESLPGLLPGRPHIVISRSAPETAHNVAATSRTTQKTHITTIPLSPDLNYVKSIEEGIDLGKKIAEQGCAQEVFIIGGGEIYKQTLPLIDRLYLTLIHQDYEGDTFFPDFSRDEWTTIAEERHTATNDAPAFTFFTLER